MQVSLPCSISPSEVRPVGWNVLNLSICYQRRIESLTMARLAVTLRSVPVITCLILAAQTVVFGATTGTIDGELKDPSGAVIPGATVTVTNIAQGIQTKSTTDARGVYTFPSLPIAHYTLKAEASGFKPKTRNDVAVDLDAVVHLDLTLELAEKATEVNVVENALQVETESTQVGEVVSGKEMTAVALNGRSYTDLLALQPGIVPMSTQQPDSVVMAGATVAINPSGTTNPGNQSISGQREDANGFMVNGADVKELMNGGTLIVPNLDSLAEFRVLTNNFDAQYGNYSGGIVNAVTNRAERIPRDRVRISAEHRPGRA